MTAKMNKAKLVLQAESGAIISHVEHAGETLIDQNNFITALWLRELRMRCLDQFAIYDKSKALALDYLESSMSSSTEYERAYGFWADRFQPDWASGILADIDDTAIVNNELLVAGRISHKQLKRDIYHMLNSLRVPKSVSDRPCWIRVGSYYTWITENPVGDNIVDVCVNTNAVALLASLNAKTAPGYQAACDTIADAIKWASNNLARLSVITPYYPSPYELMFALEHAIHCGADELVVAKDMLVQILRDLELHPEPTICSAAFGKKHWRCDAINALRYQTFECISSTANQHEGDVLCTC